MAIIDTPSVVRDTDARFYAAFVDDTRRGFWTILDDQRWDDQYLYNGTKEQAVFGAMMLNNEGIGQMDDLDELKYELAEQLEEVACEVCEKHFMRAQLHNDRCPADLS